MLDMKITTDKKASGTVLQEDIKEKRSRDELLEFCKEEKDVGMMYKVVQNNAIIKFPLYLKRSTNPE